MGSTTMEVYDEKVKIIESPQLAQESNSAPQ